MIAPNWFVYWENPGVYSPPNEAVGLAGAAVEDDSFFDNLGDTAIAYLQAQLGLGAPAPQQLVSSATVTPIGTAASTPPPQVSTGPSPILKKVCGVYKWVYPKRRRRRKLLTESDYNSLLRIETLKVNSNMKVAIAKALTR